MPRQGNRTGRDTWTTHGPACVAVLLLTALAAGCSGGNPTESPVASASRAPAIAGVPPTSVIAGASYDFVPLASDKDLGSVAFSIQNAPPWAMFDSRSGRLSGSPSPADAGTVTHAIVISVTDGITASALPPFSITVETPPNRAPVIAGQPPGVVLMGSSYRYFVNASDPDGNELRYSMSGAPSWLSIDAVSGELHGTPALKDLGTSWRLVISVSDGEQADFLPPVNLTVELGPHSTLLSWIPPATNMDESPLVDLAGFRIYYGTDADQLTEIVDLDDAGATEFLLKNLPAATCYFAVTALNRRGVESPLSNIATKVITQ